MPFRVPIQIMLHCTSIIIKKFPQLEKNTVLFFPQQLQEKSEQFVPALCKLSVTFLWEKEREKLAGKKAEECTMAMKSGS